MSDLRVWNVVNPPSRALHFPVDSPDEAIAIINKLTDVQLRDKSVISNAFGLEVFEDGEWTEWYSDVGEDIMELADEVWYGRAAAEAGDGDGGEG